MRAQVGVEKTHLTVHKGADLLLGGLGDTRVAVTEVGNADAAGEVEDLATALRLDVRALALRHDELREATNACREITGERARLCETMEAAMRTLRDVLGTDLSERRHRAAVPRGYKEEESWGPAATT